jgi:hypothetical protein
MNNFLGVVPAKAGTHNPRGKLLTAVHLQTKAITSVLTNSGHGGWVPAFAGTTW